MEPDGLRSPIFDEFYGHSAAEVTAMLERFHLKAYGAHTDLEDILKDSEKVCAYHVKML